MQLIDSEEEDDKIIAVPENDPAFHHLHEIADLPRHNLEELQRFFEEYKILERKAVFMDGWLPRTDAYRIIKESVALYDAKFGLSAPQSTPATTG
jgi:inorganic pyrophosphatase